ncbi:GDP-mannose 4,6-dehydratase [Paracoccus liaowanqingii]|uniref:GDP-mannose 4,6-dehydratase n=1 Tax=Paracoccus liaowanqingii TaxID=2560053 RepID=UPI00267AD7C7
MERLIAGVEVIYHLACLGVRHSVHSPLLNHEVNATATLQLLRMARIAGVGRFVHVSSSEVYGTAMTVPMTESHPTYPMTVYGGAKLAGEAYARAFHRTYGFPTVVVRPFNTFGRCSHHEGDSGEVIPKFMLRALAGKPVVIFGDGQQTRDFIHVRDTAAAIVLCGQSDQVIGETINIGSGQEITINHLSDIVAEVVGRDLQREYQPERPGDTLRLFSDPAKAKGLLGFVPQVSLREGLEDLLTWYQRLGSSVQMLLDQELVRNWEVPS